MSERSDLLLCYPVLKELRTHLSLEDFLSTYAIAQDTGESLRNKVRNHMNTTLAQDDRQNNLQDNPLLASQWRPLLRLLNGERKALYANTIAPQPTATLLLKVAEKVLIIIAKMTPMIQLKLTWLLLKSN